ncbi:Uncharacterised protein [Mycobacterium tuberculosis]|uniref:Uncharacterized protein n=1 Tax=Mycobacterium tuberculosis TaxID=1773 RepID=A0A655I750_MYCTX|nr:Uncharacterised protein [Mycobacterium tuberculosis]CNW78601.1 Uncharacterised protein [Mycobacterium tuberculosis]COV60862.1 Uncharacterised protein [Mycobacterium tuberculosis]COX69899.1 Uncharacterised protein [Mycobacterium tuberculosis]
MSREASSRTCSTPNRAGNRRTGGAWALVSRLTAATTLSHSKTLSGVLPNAGRATRVCRPACGSLSRRT